MSRLGAENNAAKMTADSVRDIRTSRLGLAALAKKYGVSAQTVHEAGTGKTWGHVDTPVRSWSKSLTERILEKVEFDTNGGCWLWAGRRNKTHDRGVIKIDEKSVNAARAAFEAFHDIAPGKAHVCHKCDVSLCVNPEHLYLGDAKSNARDRSLRSTLSPQLGQALADQIREATGSTEEVARRFGVSMLAVSRIKQGVAWSKRAALKSTAAKEGEKS